MVPVASVALGLGLLTRDRRRGVNFFTSTYSQLLLAANGVHLNVIGAENLTAQRPAVFIFNHRNQVDPSSSPRWCVTTGPRSARRSWKATRSSAPWVNYSTPSSSTATTPQPRWKHCTRSKSVRKTGSRSSLLPRAPGSTPPRSGVQERAVSHRDGSRYPDRADRDPQRRDHRRPQLHHDEPRHGRCRGVSADSGR
ncbi:putative l-3-phosphoserine phosphatase/1-acyl-sn-glycerol-3-phosphate acyltransferase [Mycobacterium xenopi 4042]|uniref:Putative l-3-phosphoserine phosphatase/1-acyl-sn-glycerol-3-phosphate acyltransferase n=1 Tax=Mycobacterium xenopi 4042 TaxID=1299334 RepID=X8AQ12_MYCXE|nr:putative l-3-phosphoserine phosphatase/1-acyl-sn-glycerol-3-phosphate acyltransferase [Mycobacterium xenopi 4042]